MSSQMSPELDAFCGDIISTFEGELTWKWDGRFNTVLIEFTAEYNDRVRSLLDQHLNSIWDSSNIGEAPEAVQTVCTKMGNLRAGQLLFTSDGGQNGFILCAWWPWGSGAKVSIRIAPVYDHLAGDDMITLVEQIKNRFNI